jgi:hypothetical protein
MKKFLLLIILNISLTYVYSQDKAGDQSNLDTPVKDSTKTVVTKPEPFAWRLYLDEWERPQAHRPTGQ